MTLVKFTKNKTNTPKPLQINNESIKHIRKWTNNMNIKNFPKNLKGY